MDQLPGLRAQLAWILPVLMGLVWILLLMGLSLGQTPDAGSEFQWSFWGKTIPSSQLDLSHLRDAISSIIDRVFPQERTPAPPGRGVWRINEELSGDDLV